MFYLIGFTTALYHDNGRVHHWGLKVQLRLLSITQPVHAQDFENWSLSFIKSIGLLCGPTSMVLPPILISFWILGGEGKYNRILN